MKNQHMRESSRKNRRARSLGGLITMLLLGVLIQSCAVGPDYVQPEYEMPDIWQARLVEGLSTAESVREASLRVLESRRERGESDHPFFWAAFVAAGDWR